VNERLDIHVSTEWSAGQDSQHQRPVRPRRSDRIGLRGHRPASTQLLTAVQPANHQPAAGELVHRLLGESLCIELQLLGAADRQHQPELTLLRPHLSQAYENARQLAAAFSRPRNLLAVLKETWGLTSRESEVAFWVAEGKTNPEIALILGIAARTIEKHMEHVLAKLHLENRVAVALRLQRLRAGDNSDLTERARAHLARENH
jgi:DNA-binding CsgD family transcriptional regulator